MLFTIPAYASDYIVTLKENVNADGYNLKPIIEEAGIYLTDIDTANMLYSRGFASSVSEDAPLKIPETDIISDISYEENLAVYNEDYNDPYYSEEIYYEQSRIKEYIATYQPSGKVRIAVIDSGIHREHLDFANTDIETGYNFVINSTDTSDLVGHGTMVTSIIAAGVNDGRGGAGIASNATIVPLVALTKVDGETKGTSSNLVAAIKSAVDDYNCKIITTSLGVTSSYQAINEAVKYANSKGVIVISAAGNSGANSDEAIATQLSYPASSPGAISVGATDNNYNRASYSQKNTRVDVVTYGGYLTMPSYTSTNTYVRAMGTSFSCPVIAGITALFVSNHPDITPEEYSHILKGGAMDIGELGNSDYMGYGMPDCMAMESMYNDSHQTFISPVYNGTQRNIKVISDNSITNAVLITATFNNDFIKDFSINPISFENGYAYIKMDTATDKTKYFIIESLDSLKSLSMAVEY